LKRITLVCASSVCLSLGLLACGSDPEEKAGQVGDGCTVGSADDACAAGLSCDPLAQGTSFVCGVPVTIRGTVQDALTLEAVEGSRVVALAADGSPVGDVAYSGADGGYSVVVSAPRNADGSVAETAKWTLGVSAQGYLPFPAGPRPAIPIFANQLSDTEQVQAANTDVTLLPLENPELYSHQISGTISAPDPGGTLVVAEGGSVPAPYGIASRSGEFVLFNVPGGQFEIAGYKRGQQLTRPSADATATFVQDVQLETADLPLGGVSGNVNIVNAPGGSLTSVVLVPQSVFDSTLERGPIPLGLRAPGLPEAPSVSGQFALEGVPNGDYMVLAAFENDGLVRDPDSSIGGTTLQTVSVASGEAIAMSQSFKITEGLAIVGPGADAPETVSGPVVFKWADDSSEDRYELELYTALGDLVWEDRAVPSGRGGSAVELAYSGPALLPGMFYQFRVTSYRDRGTAVAISRSEDLRGVFEYHE